MSRIYHNQPLSTLPVVNKQWGDNWPPATGSGNGVLIEGDIESRSRIVVTDAKNKKERYYILHVKVSRAHRRQFESTGKEIEPNFSDTGKVRTGYLSYKTESKGQTDKLSMPELEKEINIEELLAISGKGKTNSFAIWIEEDQLKNIELEDGDSIRIKTKNKGPFLESIAKLDTKSATVSNYAGGENVGSSWTDKVMTVKAQNSSKPLPQDQNEGVDEDEWDD